MEYLNTKTGATFSSPFAISGGDWVRSIEHKAQQTGVIEIPETQNSEENVQLDTNVIEEQQQEEQNSTDQEEITKAQIMQELDAFGVEYNPRDKKQVLYDLMMQHGK